MRPIPTPTDREMKRILRQIEYEPNTGCWLWSGSTSAFGYAAIFAGGKSVPGHRLFYSMHIGPIPDRAADGTPCLIRHRCDTPACVNPSHLVSGSHTDNMRDMYSRGRANPSGKPGRNHQNARLTDDDVAEMIRRQALGESASEISADFPVGAAHIAKILNGQRWKVGLTRNIAAPRPVRVIRGENNASAKLAESDVREILTRLRQGDKLRPLADRYGVSIHTVWDIKHRKSWAHVEFGEQGGAGDHNLRAEG